MRRMICAVRNLDCMDIDNEEMNFGIDFSLPF